MPRQVRIEYAGAFYHVMARGNRREDIVFDEEDRKTYLRTLGEACKRAGFRIHAYVLMSNHYHLLLETPQANLTAGMGLGVGVHFHSFSGLKEFEKAAAWLRRPTPPAMW